MQVVYKSIKAFSCRNISNLLKIVFHSHYIYTWLHNRHNIDDHNVWLDDVLKSTYHIKADFLKVIHLVSAEADLPYGFPKTPVPLQPLYLTEGDTAVLPCAATGSPKPTVRWFQSHFPIEFTDPRMKVLPDNSLQIVNLTMRSMGLFECEMSNSVGRRMSQRVGIFVKRKKSKHVYSFLVWTFPYLKVVNPVLSR